MFYAKLARDDNSHKQGVGYNWFEFGVNCKDFFYLTPDEFRKLFFCEVVLSIAVNILLKFRRKKCIAYKFVSSLAR